MAATDTKALKQLLEAGVHFGHQTNRWNPKMKKYIFGAKSGIYVIDLEKTSEYLEKARIFLHDVARAGSYILFVGTKKQAQDIIRESAEKSGMFYVNQRWLGGTLTNFATIRKSIRKLEKLEKMKTDGTYEEISKKERSRNDKEIEKLLKNLAGIRKMDRLPGAVYVVDSKKEEIAIREAKKLGIPVIALVDTNCNPDLIDYVIPGNDDALKSISLITTFITDSIVDGRNQFIAGSQEKAEEKARMELDEAGVDETEVEELIEGDIRLKVAEKVTDETATAPKLKKKPTKKTT
ncbi:MAG: 30S ribosomal protein S2 [Candidatus Omnitrophica bacterium]|nr:30S ribosomal protein S2 [Candidatus Omnitrophota bacterium]